MWRGLFVNAALVIECKYFETDILMELFLGNGVVCAFVARWIKVAEVPTLNSCREFSWDFKSSAELTS